MKTIFGKKCLLDTNILVFARDRASSHFAIAQKLFIAIKERQFDCYIALNTLFEFSAVLTRVYHLPQSEAVNDVSMLQKDSNITVLFPTSALLNDYLICMQQDFDIHIFDLILISTARVYGLDCIITDDKDFLQIPDISVYNPFA